MLYAVILAGGTGTRFWPFSRQLEPKQFLRLLGKDTLLQATIRRARKLVKPKNIFVVTNKLNFYEAKEQLSKFNIPDANIILEPEGKNTAPAIALCAQIIFRQDNDALLLIFPSDHFIGEHPVFCRTIKKAIACAEKNLLVTLGIKPKAPLTGYGYIKVEEKIDKYCFKVGRFIEKPNLKQANKFFKAKDYFWNCGIFVWKAKEILKEIKKYLPNLHSAISKISDSSSLEKIWNKIEPISIDYGVLEHSKRLVLVPADFFWTDLGSWDSLGAFFTKNKGGNVLNGDTLDLDSKDTCVFSQSGRLICTVGLKDLIIADTPDALLVCNRKHSQRVKEIVEILNKNKRKEGVVHLYEKRPWGSFSVLKVASRFKIKMLEILPGRRLSLQLHHKRAEHWVVVSGVAKVTRGEEIRLVKSNESIFIPKGIKHRLENPINLPLKIVEVQTGDYLEEDDIQRLDDDFQKR